MASPEPSLLLFMHFPGCYSSLTSFYSSVILLHEVKMKLSVAQMCLTLFDPMNCSLPGSSVHGILQARILEWVAIPFSGRSYWPRDWMCISCIAGRFFYSLSHQGSPILLHILPLISYFHGRTRSWCFVVHHLLSSHSVLILRFTFLCCILSSVFNSLDHITCYLSLMLVMKTTDVFF